MSNTIYHFGIKGMRWGVRRGTKKINRYKSDNDFDNEEVVELKRELNTILRRTTQKRQKIVDDGRKEASKLMETSLLNNLISSLRNEQATNDACDNLKNSGLFDDFYF